MSHDGRLPDNVSDADIDALYPEHDPRCPCHEDQPRSFECGGVEEHFCSFISREINGCPEVEPECKCEELADDDDADKSDAAEARADAMRMGD